MAANFEEMYLNEKLANKQLAISHTDNGFEDARKSYNMDTEAFFYAKDRKEVKSHNWDAILSVIVNRNGVIGQDISHVGGRKIITLEKMAIFSHRIQLIEILLEYSTVKTYYHNISPQVTATFLLKYITNVVTFMFPLWEY